MLLIIIVAYLPKVKKVNMNYHSIVDFDPSQMELEDA